MPLLDATDGEQPSRPRCTEHGAGCSREAASKVSAASVSMAWKRSRLILFKIQDPDGAGAAAATNRSSFILFYTNE